jgi:hypothetical protein
MAGKAGAVMSVTDGYGFSLHDDVRGGNNSSCLTLSYETRELAEAAADGEPGFSARSRCVPGLIRSRTQTCSFVGDAGATQVLVESVELAHEGIRKG